MIISANIDDRQCWQVFDQMFKLKSINKQKLPMINYNHEELRIPRYFFIVENIARFFAPQCESGARPSHLNSAKILRLFSEVAGF